MIKKILQENKNNISTIKKYFLISFLVFTISFLIGILFVILQPEVAENALEKIEEEFSFIRDLNNIQLGFFIFLNNSIKIFLFIFLGLIFAIPTLFFLITNGFVLGLVIAVMFPYLGFKGIFDSLFYHGIFELPALFLGSALGIWIGTLSIKKINKIKKLKELLKNTEIKNAFLVSLNVFFSIIVPLLIVAAIIETILISYYK